MRWLCTDTDGSASDRIIETPLASEAAEDYVQAIHDEDPSSMDRRTVTIQQLGPEDVPVGDARTYTVHVEITHTYTAYED